MVHWRGGWLACVSKDLDGCYWASVFLRAGLSTLDQCEIHIPPKVSLILPVEMMLDCQFCFTLVTTNK
jgi:hypothetical protein